MTINIYIDCSRTYVFGGNYGIPRVVRNLVNNASSTDEYKVIPVVMSFGRFRQIKLVPYKSEWIIKFIKNIKSLIRYQKFTSSNLNARRVEKKRSIIYNILTIPLFFNKKIVPNTGDIFITTDNFFMATFPDYVNKLIEASVIISSMQHDLIPIRFSQFYSPEDVASFKSHLENSLRFSDICITVSDYVKFDLENYIKENVDKIKDLNENIKIASYRHGYNICDSKSKISISGNILKQIFSRPTYIIVSTIEPRKNHAYLLNAFEKIWDSGIQANLLIIGKVGWMVDNLIQRIKNHKQFGKQLFMINNMPDSELLYCYRNAKALITPSVTEGFGLPIIEALSQKTPVLASDIPVFREVGGDFCTYFDLSDHANLAQIIINWEESGQKPSCRDINEFTWPTWKESAEEFIEKIMTLS